MITILETIIAVVVVYLIFSIMVFALVEGIATFVQLRGKTLKTAVFKILGSRSRNGTFAAEVYDHPQIQTLQKADNKLTSYIPASHISAAIIDIIGTIPPTLQLPAPLDNPRQALPDAGLQQENEARAKAMLFNNFVQNIELQPDSQIKTLLRSLALQANNMETLRKSIEGWFDNCMDRATGWYKRKIKLVVFIIAGIITIGFNIDTLFIIKAARQDSTLRRELNNLADRLVNDPNVNKLVTSLPGPDNDYYEDYEDDASVTSADSTAVTTADQPLPGAGRTTPEERIEQLKALENIIGDTALPVGWTDANKKFTIWKTFGWALSILALSAGAPFWFDILKKLVNLRTTGPKPQPAPQNN